MGMASIRVEGVNKTFSGTPVLSDVHLEIADGEFFFILGPSGCGKSTLLRIIAGLESADSGAIYMDGARVDGIPPHRRGIGMVFQQYALWPHMTVEQNISFGLEVQRLPESERRARVQEMLDLVQLSELGSRYPSQLSGGQQQRVALARALAIRPQVVLLDEPLSNLDARLRDDIRNELAELHRQLGTTMVYVTHDQEDALTLSWRLAVLNRGRVAQVGRPNDVYEHPADSFVASFLGSANFIPCTITDQDSERLQVRLDITNGPTVSLPRTSMSPEAHRTATNPYKRILCIRPEKMLVVRADGNQLETPLKGTVRRVAYKGSYTDAEIALEELTIKTRVVTSQHRLHAGDSVGLGWIEDSAILVEG